MKDRTPTAAYMDLLAAKKVCAKHARVLCSSCLNRGLYFVDAPCKYKHRPGKLCVKCGKRGDFEALPVPPLPAKMESMCDGIAPPGLTDRRGSHVAVGEYKPLRDDFRHTGDIADAPPIDRTLHGCGGPMWICDLIGCEAVQEVLATVDLATIQATAHGMGQENAIEQVIQFLRGMCEDTAANAVAEHFKFGISEMSNVDEALAEMGRKLLSQDNECTGDPIFLVQQRRRSYGYDTNYAASDDYIAWVDSESEATGQERAALEAKFQETGEEPEGWHRTGFVDTWEFVQPFFTRAAAEQYIETNRHRMKDPRVFVDSAYRNKEWQAIRAFLVASAAHPAEGTPT